MRSLWKTLDPPLLRDIAMVGLAIGVVGVSFGAIAISRGEPAWVPLTMSLTVFAAGAQLAALDITLGGGGTAAAVAAGLVLNARLPLFGLAVADVLGGVRWPARLLGSHALVDQSAAFALAQREPARRRAAFFVCGALLYVMWNLGTLLGVVAGRAMGDPGALGLDAAEPMVLLALVLPALREPRTRRAALLGAAIALGCTPFLPGGLPVLVALVGVAAAAAGGGTGGSRGAGGPHGTGGSHDTGGPHGTGGSHDTGGARGPGGTHDTDGSHGAAGAEGNA
ncbi:AzlC family ABC transporter permease [Streptomyces milbemycinicus]|uniref:AzlC family ABC transporter permease n=1 Tax=Streptomyces milbemycinicus TaxID=476552 RepID=UPI001B80B3BF|nr:AzlC family ABC transporter permease [Streptomyces milbemycinicus]